MTEILRSTSITFAFTFHRLCTPLRFLPLVSFYPVCLYYSVFITFSKLLQNLRHVSPLVLNIDPPLSLIFINITNLRIFSNGIARNAQYKDVDRIKIENQQYTIAL